MAGKAEAQARIVTMTAAVIGPSMELRSEAEAKLGPKFDIRGFHDTFLGMGAVPLTVLEQQMREWIRKQKAKP